MWVQRALRSKLRVVPEWRMIFPRSVNRTVEAWVERRDYSEFDYCFLHNLELPLSKLVDYAAPDQHGGAQKSKELLTVMHGLLPSKKRAHRGSEMGDVLVEPKWFIANYPRPDFHLDERCLFGEKMSGEHPDLAKWLRSKEGRYVLALGDAADGSERQRQRSPTTHPLRKLIAEIYYELKSSAEDDPANDRVWSRLSGLASSEQSFHPILDEVTQDEIHWHDGNEPKVMIRKTFQTFMAELRGGTSLYCRENQR